MHEHDRYRAIVRKRKRVSVLKVIGEHGVTVSPPTEVEAREILRHTRSFLKGMLNYLFFKYGSGEYVKSVSAAHKVPAEVCLCRALTEQRGIFKLFDNAVLRF